MIQLLSILIAAVVLVGFSASVGRALLARTRIRLLPQELLFFSFLLGSTCLAVLVFAIRATTFTGTAALMHPLVFIALPALIAYLAFRKRGQTVLENNIPPAPGLWTLALWIALVTFGFLYLSLALAPETSVDGTTYYLPQIADALQPRDLQKDLRNAFPGADSMLLLFMYVTGDGSGAAMVSLLFLLATAIGIASFGRRFAEPRAGVLAAVLVFASPIIGRVATIAAPDIWICAMLFGVFYAMKLARAERNTGMLWVSAILLLSLASTMTPWLLREFAKPLLHLNGWYPQIPVELAVHGDRLGGLLGPVFLLTPLALLSLGKPIGRQLVLMGIVFAAPALGGMETRVLVPALPYGSLALAMILVQWRLAAPAVLVAHLVMSWPTFTRLYVDPGAWRPEGSEWLAALRWTPEEEYLSRKLPGYRLGIRLDEIVPPDQPVLSLSPFPSIYLDRTVLDAEQSLEGDRLREVIWAATLPRRQPIHIGELAFDAISGGSLRIRPQTAEGTGRWGINELTVWAGESEQSVSLTANPANEGIPFAVDRNPTTRWTSGRAALADMWIELELELSPDRSADKIVVTGADDQFRPLQLEVSSDGWQSIASTFVAMDAPPEPAVLFEGVRRELIRAGVHWIVGEGTDGNIRLLLGHPDAQGFVRRAAEGNLALVEVLPPVEGQPGEP